MNDDKPIDHMADYVEALKRIAEALEGIESILRSWYLMQN